MTNKLLILDKDFTIVKPKSGETFVQHPEDQELLPGVSDRIAEYAANGWAIVVASNQGGCAVQKCKAIDFPVNAYYANGDEQLKVTAKDLSGRSPVLYTAKPRHNGKRFLVLGSNSEVRFRYKTIEDTIAEMEYLMKLLPEIEACWFCPDFEGDTAYLVKQDFSRKYNSVDRGEEPYRKPSCGMIQIALTAFNAEFQRKSVLFVGDRDEDQQAAAAAGVKFMWADTWRVQANV